MKIYSYLLSSCCFDRNMFNIKVTSMKLFVVVICYVSCCIDHTFALRCGLRPLDEMYRTGRIVGGTPVVFGQVPWYGTLLEQRVFGFIRQVKCGVVLIDFQWVLTAAHCAPKTRQQYMKVILGGHHLPENVDQTKPVRQENEIPHPFDRFVQERNVIQVIVHPRYDHVALTNDIALLKLNSPVQFNFNTQPICLPPRDELFAGWTGQISGFGTVTTTGNVNVLPQVLQVAQIPILSNRECRKMFETAGMFKPVYDNEICAGYKQGGVDSCKGDSGGPLVVYDQRRSSWHLVGIVSNGIMCAQPSLPGVYMRVTSYLDWIRESTKSTSDVASRLKKIN